MDDETAPYEERSERAEYPGVVGAKPMLCSLFG